MVGYHGIQNSCQVGYNPILNSIDKVCSEIVI